MKKFCHRTQTSGNYEPEGCIGNKCTMFGKVGGLEGCLEVNYLLLMCIESIDRQSAKEPTKVEVTPEPEVEETVDTKEDKDAGKTDSRTGNILEGGTDPVEQHDSDGSSSPE